MQVAPHSILCGSGIGVSPAPASVTQDESDVNLGVFRAHVWEQPVLAEPADSQQGHLLSCPAETGGKSSSKVSFQTFD